MSPAHADLHLDLEVRGRAGGPLVVAGPAVTLTRRSLERLSGELEGAGFRVAAWDLPGHGPGADPPRDWTVGEAATWLADAIAERFGDAATPWLLGVSLGAYVSLEAAPLLPGVAGLVLVGAEGTPPVPFPPDRLAVLDRWERTGSLDPSTAAFMAMAELGDAHPEVGGHADLLRADPSAGARLVPAYRALTTRRDPASIGAELDVPTLVVRGADDPFVTAGAARALAELLGGSLVEVPGSHQPQHTAAGAVAAAVVSFVRTDRQRSIR